MDIMALFTEKEMRPSKKRTQSLQSNMEEMVMNKALESPEMASDESRSESQRTPVERSPNSSWEKVSLKSERAGAVCKRRVL